MSIRLSTTIARAAILAALLVSTSHAADAPTRLRATAVKQLGTVAPAEAPADAVVLANEVDGGSAWVRISFDLSSFAQRSTPRAILSLPGLERMNVRRPGVQMSQARGALQVFVPGDGDRFAAAGPVKPGGAAIGYVLDVTDAISRALAKGERSIDLDVKMLGQPSGLEVYKMPTSADATPTLDLSSPANVRDDRSDRLAPFDAGATVYREAAMAIVKDRADEYALTLMYPVKRVVEVVRLHDGATLQAGRDYVLRDGKVVLPAGSRAPVQLDAEFYLRAPKPTTNPAETPGKPTRTSVQLQEGTWYHERQMEVTYEPASRDWPWPAPASSPDKLPRTSALLKEARPLRIVLFGDSISWGHNASRLQGAWPFQPAYGELVAWQLEQRFKSPITFMNHARAGGTSAFGLTQVDSQVGHFKPDLCILAFGMNDRAEQRRSLYKSNLEQIIDRVRAKSPDTEFVLVTSMLNNPKQPTGLDPVKFLRDEALKIDRPGVAFADVTGAHLAILAHKDYLDTSGNGANHPNDFLHRVYAQEVLKVLVPNR